MGESGRSHPTVNEENEREGHGEKDAPVGASLAQLPDSPKDLGQAESHNSNKELCGVPRSRANGQKVISYENCGAEASQHPTPPP